MWNFSWTKLFQIGCVLFPFPLQRDKKTTVENASPTMVSHCCFHKITFDQQTIKKQNKKWINTFQNEERGSLRLMTFKVWSVWSDVKAKLTSNLHAGAGTRWSLILKHQNLPIALLQKNLWISGNLPPEPGLCSSWRVSSARHVRSPEVIVQRRLRIGGHGEGGKAGAPTSCLDSLADPAREAEDRHMVAWNLLTSPWPTTKTGKKGQNYALSIVSGGIWHSGMLRGTNGDYMGQIVYRAHGKAQAKTRARVLLRRAPPRLKIFPKCCCCILILVSLPVCSSCQAESPVIYRRWKVAGKTSDTRARCSSRAEPPPSLRWCHAASTDKLYIPRGCRHDISERE